MNDPIRRTPTMQIRWNADVLEQMFIDERPGIGGGTREEVWDPVPRVNDWESSGAFSGFRPVRRA